MICWATIQSSSTWNHNAKFVSLVDIIFNVRFPDILKNFICKWVISCAEMHYFLYWWVKKVIYWDIIWETWFVFKVCRILCIEYHYKNERTNFVASFILWWFFFCLWSGVLSRIFPKKFISYSTLANFGKTITDT